MIQAFAQLYAFGHEAVGGTFLTAALPLAMPSLPSKQPSTIELVYNALEGWLDVTCAVGQFYQPQGTILLANVAALT